MNNYTNIDDIIHKLQDYIKKKDYISSKNLLEQFSNKLEFIYLDKKIEHRNKENDMTYYKYKKIYKEIKKELKFLEYDHNKSQLLDHPKDIIIDINNDINNDTLIKHGIDTMEKSNTSLKNTLNTIDASKKIGGDINTKLDNQTEKISKINNNVDDIESILNRTKKIISRIGRKILTDKYICCITILIVIIIIVILVLKYSNKVF